MSGNYEADVAECQGTYKAEAAGRQGMNKDEGAGRHGKNKAKGTGRRGMNKDEGAGRKKEVRRIKGGEYQNLEATSNQMQVHDDGEGRDADDGAAAAAERHHRQFGVKPLRLYLIIPKSMTETALRKQFEQFGAIEYVSVVKDKVSSTSRRFGYVKFFQFSHGAKAFAGCNPNYKPKFADPRPRWVEHRAHYGGSNETKLADLRTEVQRKRSCGEVLGRSRY